MLFALFWKVRSLMFQRWRPVSTTKAGHFQILLFNIIAKYVTPLESSSKLKDIQQSHASQCKASVMTLRGWGESQWSLSLFSNIIPLLAREDQKWRGMGSTKAKTEGFFSDAHWMSWDPFKFWLRAFAYEVMTLAIRRKHRLPLCLYLWWILVWGWWAASCQFCHLSAYW